VATNILKFCVDSETETIEAVAERFVPVLISIGV